MKKITKQLAFSFLILFVSNTNAQTLNFGHLDFNALIMAMPEFTATQQELNNFRQDHEDILQELQESYQLSIQEFEQMGEESELRQNAKIEEIQDLETRIQDYRINAQQQIEQKYQELMDPVYQKATAAIEQVAAAQNLIYVFNTSGDAVLYKSNQSIDLLPLVRQQLGIE